MSPILITGALGNVGSAIVAEASAAGCELRVADVSAEALAERFDGMANVRFDFTDPATWQPAFVGVEVMFLMRPPQLSNIARDMVPALEAAKAAGVRHVVLLSLQGAERNRVVPHAKIEQWLRTSGLDWTFVRPSFFMENLSTTHAVDIRDHDSIVVPAGNGRTSFVAASDVAAVATAALVDPAEHRMRAWTPTGSVALTYDEVAEILTELLGRPIRYTRPGILRYVNHAVRQLHMPIAMAGVTVAIYTIARFGKASGTTDDVRTVTGRDPVTFEHWAGDHLAAWRTA
jgi:uncharacterized protein YbjT (DUF2867 family)